MGGKQSKDSASQSRALFSIRSTSLDSISTSVSQRTLQSTGPVLPHSPSLDTIGQQHAETNGRVKTKDSKGNTYVLLETASVTTAESEFPQLSTTEKKKLELEGGVGQETSGDKPAARGNGGETTGSKSGRRTGGGGHLTSSLPAESAPVTSGSVSGGGGVSTRTATELASRKDLRQQNTNKSKLVQRVLPTRSQSSRAAVKTATAMVAPEQRKMEREVQQLLKSMLKQQQQQQQQKDPESPQTTTNSTDSKDPPSPPTSAQLPESLLQCSHQELNHLASYICHTIKDTLQSSLVEQALTAQQKKSITTGRETETTTTSMPSEDPVSDRTLSAAAADGSESPRRSGGSGVGFGEQCLVGREPEERVQRRRHKRQRRERPVSSPGVYCDQDPHVHLSDPQTSQTGVTSSGIGSPQSPSHELQSQTHSNEESYYHRCAGEQSPDTKTCRACRQHSRKFHSPNADEPPHRAEQRRKRTGRSKDVPVDVSLDDNCPGVNLIRRRYTHRHVVCDNCLQSFGKDAVCGRQSRRPRHKQQSTVSLEAPCGNELKLSSHNNRQEVQGVGEGSGFITLYQLRTVAQILQESSGCVDDNVTQYEREQQKPTGPPKSQSFRHERRQHNQFRVNKSKRKSVVFDDCLSVAQSTELEHDEVGPSSPEQRLSHLKELAYPTKSRSGRDSPATDMAVIDLTVNSPCMLRPLDPRLKEAATITIHAEDSPSKITHLHHHYHHIINHGEP